MILASLISLILKNFFPITSCDVIRHEFSVLCFLKTTTGRTRNLNLIKRLSFERRRSDDGKRWRHVEGSCELKMSHLIVTNWRHGCLLSFISIILISSNFPGQAVESCTPGLDCDSCYNESCGRAYEPHSPLVLCSYL